MEIYCTSNDTMCYDFMLELFLETLRPYLYMLEQWIEKGLLVDSFGEFMIERWIFWEFSLQYPIKNFIFRVLQKFCGNIKIFVWIMKNNL